VPTTNPKKKCSVEGCLLITRAASGLCLAHDPARSVPVPKPKRVPKPPSAGEVALAVAREGLCSFWAPERREHFWLVDKDIDAFLPEWWERHHRPGGDFVCVVCRDCHQAHHVHRADAPPSGFELAPRTFSVGAAGAA
jgi:hypothetical protein